MIPEKQLQLLTAGVDGELSSAELRRLERLLATSAQARAVFTQLKTDRVRVATQTRHTPPAGLCDRILASLSLLPAYMPVVVPSTTLPFTRPTRRPWVPLAVAAAVYFVLSAGSLLYFVGSDPAESQRIAPDLQAKLNTAASYLPPEDQHPSMPSILEPLENQVASIERPQPTTPVVGPERPENPSLQPTVNPELHAFPPIRPIAPFDAIRVRIPFLIPAADLEREDVREQLRDELGRDPAFRIDVFAHDPTRAAELFQSGSKATGVQLFVDATAHDRIKRKQAGSFVLYIDSLTASELRDLLVRLATDDAKASHRSLHAFHATPVMNSDVVDAKSVFGTSFDLVPNRRPSPLPVAGADTKSISANTADELAKNLTAKHPDKSAILMSLTPSRTPPALSKELTQYRDRRGERRPDTVAVMIVIRPHP